MAQATVPPVEIVSSPSSSHSELAATTASASLTPHRGPRANRFSYSILVFLPPGPLTRCSHPIEHDAHELRATCFSSDTSLTSSAGAPSNVAAEKLRVGSVEIALNVSRLAIVPSSRYFAVAGPNERSRRFLDASRTPLG